MPTSRTSAIAIVPLAARSLGVLRALIGVSALITPALLATPWVGHKEAARTSVRLLGRTLGGRDLALGIGVVLAREEHGALSSWLLLGALADACDTGATLASFSKLPMRSRWLVLALTTGAALGGVVVGLATLPKDSSRT